MTPSSSALCASIGPAHHVADGVDVRQVRAAVAVDLDEAARVTLSPTCRRPGRRCSAPSHRHHEPVALELLRGALVVGVVDAMPDFFAATLPIFTPSLMSRPAWRRPSRLPWRRPRRPCPGMPGSTSSTVTSARGASRRCRAPARDSRADHGELLRHRIEGEPRPSLSHTVTLSTGMAGRCRALEPVATITCFAWTVSVSAGPPRPRSRRCRRRKRACRTPAATRPCSS
jgi:hypothetical protein